jgi:hypothetical protein
MSRTAMASSRMAQDNVAIEEFFFRKIPPTS